MSDFDKAVFAIARALKHVAGASATVVVLQFTTPTVATRGESIVVSGTLAGALSDKAARVVATGTPVTIRYDGRVLLRANGAVLAHAINVRVLRYDALRGTYVVVDDGRSTEHKTSAPAASAFSAYALAFRGVDPRAELDLEVDAVLSYPSDRGDTRQALWGHVTPYMRIREFHRMVPRPQ